MSGERLVKAQSCAFPGLGGVSRVGQLPPRLGHAMLESAAPLLGCGPASLLSNRGRMDLAIKEPLSRPVEDPVAESASLDPP